MSRDGAGVKRFTHGLWKGKETQREKGKGQRPEGRGPESRSEGRETGILSHFFPFSSFLLAVAGTQE